jgi:hypothetical protein
MLPTTAMPMPRTNDARALLFGALRATPVHEDILRL